MSLDHIILGFLSERPRTGYDLKRGPLDTEARPFWTADQAQIYRTLDRLERSGALISRRRKQQGRPDRRVYEPTPAGREQLAEWLSSPATTPATRDPLLAKLWFASELGDHRILELLESARADHQATLDDLRARAASLSRTTHDPRRRLLRRMALDGAITRERAVVDWLDDCIEAVREGALSDAEDGRPTQRRLFGWTAS